MQLKLIHAILVGTSCNVNHYINEFDDMNTKKALLNLTNILKSTTKMSKK